MSDQTLLFTVIIKFYVCSIKGNNVNDSFLFII